ncbi:MAG TPA: TolC family protein [Polyangiales bacterium]|nr:TolC family protein [Polyangiales bacterium]
MLAGWLWFTLASSYARAEDAGATFHADEHLTLADLTHAVELGAPELAAGRRELAMARGEAQQARLLANPNVEAAWSALPVGRLNPRGLDHPYANVPNYAVGVEYTFPWRKRAPRRERADALARGAQASLEFTTRDRALELAEVLGSVATATLRREGIADLIAGGRRATEVAEARLRTGFGTPLDVDQLRIDVDRTEQLLSGAESDILENLAACASLVGMRCERFADAKAARAFLQAWLLRDDAPGDLVQRADLRALQAFASAASAESKLADALKLPDPTVRFGYVHDRFTVAGNQLNSLNLSVSVPVAVFDRGQGQKQIAEASHRHLVEERNARLAVANARVPALLERHALSLSRCQRLDSELIPRARGVLGQLESAVQSQLLPVTQVIQARRVVSELFIEEADSCGDAYRATLELAREIPARGAPK